MSCYFCTAPKVELLTTEDDKPLCDECYDQLCDFCRCSLGEKEVDNSLLIICANCEEPEGL